MNTERLNNLWDLQVCNLILSKFITKFSLLIDEYERDNSEICWQTDGLFWSPADYSYTVRVVCHKNKMKMWLAGSWFTIMMQSWSPSHTLDLWKLHHWKLQNMDLFRLQFVSIPYILTHQDSLSQESEKVGKIWYKFSSSRCDDQNGRPRSSHKLEKSIVIRFNFSRDGCHRLSHKLEKSIVISNPDDLQH